MFSICPFKNNFLNFIFQFFLWEKLIGKFVGTETLKIHQGWLNVFKLCLFTFVETWTTKSLLFLDGNFLSYFLLARYQFLKKDLNECFSSHFIKTNIRHVTLKRLCHTNIMVTQGRFSFSKIHFKVFVFDEIPLSEMHTDQDYSRWNIEVEMS